ncbi:MAG: AsmA family protein, partial [Vicinamibacterales bacterium]
MQVSDIAVDVSGERVVAARAIEVDYSIFEIISRGVVLNEIRLVEPVVKLERDANGWNVGRLVKEQEEEADREGPRAPLALQSIEIADARVEIEDRVGADGYQLPERIDDLDLKASFEYAPVHYSVVVGHLSLRGTSPQLTLMELAGKVAVRDDNLYVDQMSIRTAGSSMTIDGVIENYLDTPVLKLTTTGSVSLPEIGRVVPGVSGYALTPRFDVKASGPAEHLKLDLDLQTGAGTVSGQLTADVKAPDFAARGGVKVERLNLAPILQDPGQRSDITGHTELNLRVAGSPASAPILDRMGGTFSFNGPSVTAAGYRARNVKVTGSFEDSRITIDGRAAAYGVTATARGFIAPPADGRALAFDLRGSADRVDLRGLPAATGAPELATNLSVAEYHVVGKGRMISGSARLNESTVEGAALATGTEADFTVGPKGIAYSARGGISALNLPRIGKALRIDALVEPAYEGEINADFDLTGTLPPAGRAKDGATLAGMTIDATGTLRDSTIMGGRLPQLGFEAHLAEGALTTIADGRFEGFNPARLANRKELDGNVTGTLKVNARIEDITEPITP